MEPTKYKRSVKSNNRISVRVALYLNIDKLFNWKEKEI